MPNLLTHLNIGDQKTTINSIHYIAGTGSTAGTWLGTDSSIDEYYDGLTIAYKVPVAGASTTTLNITGSAGTALGAKTVYRNGSSKITTHYGVGSVVLLVYTTNSSNVGSWQCVDYDSDTTYTNASLGQGYGTCGTAAATAAKAVTLANYALTLGGVITVKFTYAVPASATLNVNSKGAKAIRYRGAAITANVIKAGDTATFIYDGTYYHLLAIDNAVATATQSTNGLMSSADKTKLDGLSLNVYSWEDDEEAPKIVELLSPEDYNTGNFFGSALSFTIDERATTPASFAIKAAKVAKTGSYNDLSDKPSIPSAVTEATVSGWGFTKNTGTVTGSSLTANKFVVGNGNSAIKISTMQPTTSSTSWSASSDVYVPTMKAISSYVTGLGYTKNAGTVTSVRVQAGTGLSSSVSTAQTSTLNTTISIASGYKLPTTTEWNSKQDTLVSGTNIKTINGTSLLGSGNISISAGSSYTLPTASSSTKGGIKVGAGLSMSSDTMSVSYGTSATTAAVGNDNRFGKITLNKITYVPQVPSRQYYKIALAGSNTASVDANPTATSTTMSYLPEWALRDDGIMYGHSIRLTGNLTLNNDTIYISPEQKQIGGAVNLKIENGYHIQTNKIYAPTSSNGTTYGYGSSGQVLKSNGTTVYWANDNNKTYTFNGAVSTIKDSNLTANRALISNGSGKVAVSAVTSTELGYLDGVTSNIQTQLNAKGTSNLTIGTTSTTAAAGNHTHSNYLTKSTADARYALKSEIGGGGTTSVQILTRAEYNALTTISSDVLYIVRG